MATSTLFAHIGTHKTGTTALQVLLAENPDELERAGLHVVEAGRSEVSPGFFTPGNHELAKDVMFGRTTALDALARELSERRAPFAIVSSEEFHPLYARPENLAKFVQRAHDANHTPVAIVYLRAQPSYIESLFSELVKTHPIASWSSYLGNVLDRGYFGDSDSYRLAVDYATLLDAVQRAFDGNVIVRAYRTDRGPDYLQRDFFSTLGERVGFRSLTLRSSDLHPNRSLSLLHLLENLRRGLAKNGAAPSVSDIVTAFPAADDDVVQQRFALISSDEWDTIDRRFAGSNQRILQQYGVDIAELNAAARPAHDSPQWTTQRIHRAMLDRAFEVWSEPR